MLCADEEDTALSPGPRFELCPAVGVGGFLLSFWTPCDHLALWEELPTLGVSCPLVPPSLLSPDFWPSSPSFHCHRSGFLLSLPDISFVFPDLLVAFDSVSHSFPLASLLAAPWSSCFFCGYCSSASMPASLPLAILQMWCLLHTQLGGISIHLSCSTHLLAPRTSHLQLKCCF